MTDQERAAALAAEIGRWETVRVEDTCDGLMIHPDDAKAHGLPPDALLESRMLTDTTAMVFIPSEQSAPSPAPAGLREARQAFCASVQASVVAAGGHRVDRVTRDTNEPLPFGLKAPNGFTIIPDTWFRAALSAISAAGYATQPREPTGAMIEAAIKAARQHIYIGDDADGDPCIVGFELGIRAALAAKEGRP